MYYKQLPHELRIQSRQAWVEDHVLQAASTLAENTEQTQALVEDQCARQADS